jgi:aryl-phospho-beta-D-glucosidase BglC (GH1 family)
MASSVKIAAGIKTVTQMGSEPTFEALKDEVGFPSDIDTFWGWPAEPSYEGTWFRYYEDLETAADYSRQARGYASAEWFFDYITKKGLDYLRDTFCSGAYSSTVTIQMEDENSDTVTYYGTLHWPIPAVDMVRAPGGWSGVVFRFRKLRAASA